MGCARVLGSPGCRMSLEIRVGSNYIHRTLSPLETSLVRDHFPLLVFYYNLVRGSGITVTFFVVL